MPNNFQAAAASWRGFIQACVPWMARSESGARLETSVDVELQGESGTR